MVELETIEVLVDDNMPSIFMAGEDFYKIFLRHRASGIFFTVHMGKVEKQQPNAYQRISREDGQKDLIYKFEDEIFKKYNVKGKTEEDSVRNIMLIDLESDFDKLLKIL